MQRYLHEFGEELAVEVIRLCTINAGENSLGSEHEVNSNRH